MVPHIDKNITDFSFEGHNLSHKPQSGLESTSWCLFALVVKFKRMITHICLRTHWLKSFMNDTVNHYAITLIYLTVYWYSVSYSWCDGSLVIFCSVTFSTAIFILNRKHLSSMCHSSGRHLSSTESSQSLHCVCP